MHRTLVGIPLLALLLPGCDPDPLPFGHAADDDIAADDDDATADDDDHATEGCQDSDGDGLEDDYEAILGTDPALPDTDGDAHDDGSEWGMFTDPLSAADYPYQGGWDHQPYPADLAGGAASVGDLLADFQALDQFDQQVGLHTFYGNVIQVMHSSDGCGNTWCLATTAEEEWGAYEHRGYMHIVLLATGPPEDAAPVVAEARGLTMPVLDDLTHAIGPDMGHGGVFPWRILIGRDMTVRWMGEEFPPTDIFEGALDEPWPDVDRPENPCD
jgi:hypothetical protein